MNSYTSSLASLPSDKYSARLVTSQSSHLSTAPASQGTDEARAALRFPAHPCSTTSALSTPYDTLNTTSDTAVIVIGSEHTRYYKQQHKLFISTADAIVTSDQAPIFNIEILRAAQRLSKSQRHLRIVTHDSSRAAQLLYHRLQNLIH